MWYFLIAACVSSLALPSAFGHGDVHVQIESLNPLIQTAPTADLLVKRGELYRLDEDFTAALADFDRAEKVDPAFDTVHFCRGRALFEAGRWKEAAESLDKLLHKRPDHVEGHMVRARAHFRLNEYEAALEDYDRIVALIESPTPDCFLERAETLTALGRSDAAIKNLDEGIARLGNLIALQKAAIDIETQIKRYPDALARVDRVMATLQRKEVWLARRGEILDAAGRHEEALRAYSEALTSLDQLPPHHRKTKPMRELGALLMERVGAESTQNATTPNTN